MLAQQAPGWAGCGTRAMKRSDMTRTVVGPLRQSTVQISAQPTAATSAKVPRTLNKAVRLRCCCAAPAHPLTQTC
jgi:hypothetical protein